MYRNRLPAGRRRFLPVSGRTGTSTPQKVIYKQCLHAFDVFCPSSPGPVRSPEGGKMTSLHPETHIGLVALTVANRERSVAFYQDVLGFTVVESGKADVILAAEATAPLLPLTEQAGARP